MLNETWDFLAYNATPPRTLLRKKNLFITLFFVFTGKLKIWNEKDYLKHPDLRRDWLIQHESNLFRVGSLVPVMDLWLAAALRTSKNVIISWSMFQSSKLIKSPLINSFMTLYEKDASRFFDSLACVSTRRRRRR